MWDTQTCQSSVQYWDYGYQTCCCSGPMKDLTFGGLKLLPSSPTRFSRPITTSLPSNFSPSSCYTSDHPSFSCDRTREPPLQAVLLSCTTKTKKKKKKKKQQHWKWSPLLQQSLARTLQWRHHRTWWSHVTLWDWRERMFLWSLVEPVFRAWPDCCIALSADKKPPAATTRFNC